MKKYIAPLQLITQDGLAKSHAEQVLDACKGGCKWVQFRSKHSDENWVKTEAQKVWQVCDDWGAVLIMNDKVHLVETLDMQGVHLGKTDMDVAEARKLLGEKYIIGGTANTFDDIVSLASKGVDYVGLGPFRFTETKQNLSPTLGISGYETIIKKLEDVDIYIPIVAIGGIQLADIQPILQTGVSGVAIASAVNMAIDATKAYKDFHLAMMGGKKG